jgi:hypothetical protein
LLSARRLLLLSVPAVSATMTAAAVMFAIFVFLLRVLRFGLFRFNRFRSSGVVHFASLLNRK